MSHLMPGFVLVLSHMGFFNIYCCLKMSMFEGILLHNSTNCPLKAYQDLPWHTSYLEIIHTHVKYYFHAVVHCFHYHQSLLKMLKNQKYESGDLFFSVSLQSPIFL